LAKLLSLDGHVLGSRETEANLLPADRHHLQLNIITDEYLLTFLAS
jgi:hypothetical protein